MSEDIEQDCTPMPHSFYALIMDRLAAIELPLPGPRKGYTDIKPHQHLYHLCQPLYEMADQVTPVLWNSSITVICTLQIHNSVTDAINAAMNKSRCHLHVEEWNTWSSLRLLSLVDISK